MKRRLPLLALALLGLCVPASGAGRTSRSTDSIAYSVWYFAVPDNWLAGGGLCVVGADGGAPRRLTGPEFDVAPAWSPDGLQLAFSSARNRPQPHGYDVYALELRTNAIRGVTTTSDWNEFNLDPAWSPDGRRLALAVGFHDELIIVYELASHAVWELGGDQRVSSPTWSPDGRRIAYAASNPLQTAIYIQDAEGGSAQRLVPDASQPDFSPDGTRLAYVNAADDIVVAHADGSEPRTLAATAEVESDPDWSPDGKRIAFARKLKAGSEIVASSADGTAETVVVHSPYLLSGPAWRPAGGMPSSRPPCIQQGKQGAGRLRGTPREDVIRGGAGSDRLQGYGARDSLDGGAGADIVDGGAGNDIVIGGPGRDVLIGGDGRDTIWARDRALDHVQCGRGKDYVYADFLDAWDADCEAVNRKAP